MMLNCNHPAPEISFSNVKEGLHEKEKLQKWRFALDHELLEGEGE